MNLPRAFFILAIFSFLTSCLSDIRTDKIIGDGSSSELAKAKLGVALDKLGGFSNWEAKQYVEVKMRDYWPKWLTRKMFMVYEFSGQLFQVQFKRNEFNARLTFLEGEDQGAVWGLQNWQTYKVDRNQQMDWQHDKDVHFWVPTVQYFTFMPFYLYQDGDVFMDAGPFTLGGSTYERVFVSWGRAEPQKKIDQYLIWINQDTGMIDYIQYTVRELFGPAVGTAHMKDYRSFEGIQVATKQSVIDGVGKESSIMHEFVIEDVQFMDSLPVGILFPDPSKNEMKKEK